MTARSAKYISFFRATLIDFKKELNENVSEALVNYKIAKMFRFKGGIYERNDLPHISTQEETVRIISGFH